MPQKDRQPGHMCKWLKHSSCRHVTETMLSETCLNEIVGATHGQAMAEQEAAEEKPPPPTWPQQMPR